MKALEFLQNLQQVVNSVATPHSTILRDNEDPPSFAAHVSLDGKEYVVLAQPTDIVPKR